MKLSDLVKEESLIGLIQAEVQQAKIDEAKNLAKLVGQRLQKVVNDLRAAREHERNCKNALKRLNDAINEYDKTGDKAVLRKVGLL